MTEPRRRQQEQLRVSISSINRKQRGRGITGNKADLLQAPSLPPPPPPRPHLLILLKQVHQLGAEYSNV